MSTTAEQTRIIDIIANQLGVDKEMVTPGANIVDDLGGRFSRCRRTGNGDRGSLRHGNPR